MDAEMVYRPPPPPHTHIGESGLPCRGLAYTKQSHSLVPWISVGIFLQLWVRHPFSTLSLNQWQAVCQRLEAASVLTNKYSLEHSWAAGLVVGVLNPCFLWDLLGSLSVGCRYILSFHVHLQSLKERYKEILMHWSCAIKKGTDDFLS